MFSAIRGKCDEVREFTSLGADVNAQNNVCKLQYVHGTFCILTYVHNYYVTGNLTISTGMTANRTCSKPACFA